MILAVAFLASLAGSPSAPVPSRPVVPPRVVSVSIGASDPAISPDGSRIAVSILGKIWLLPVGGGDATQVTFGTGWDAHPAWSPDGGFLAYAHARPSGSEIVVHNFGTGADAVVHHPDGGVGPIAWHPKGGAMFFVVERGQYDAHLWRIGVAGDSARQLTFTQSWHEWSFAPSPDGSEILLESGRYGGADLYLIATDSGGAVTRLTKTPANEFAVAWSRNGATRAWIVGDNGVDSVMVQPAGGNAKPRRVFSSAYDQKQLALDPTGRFAVLCAGRKLYRLDLTTGASAPIPFTARYTLPELPAADLAITHARVWTGASADVVSDATVVVRDGRIVAVQPATASVAPLARLIDAKGKTLLPGLMDNHWHYWSSWDGQRLLSRGVTTIRDPGVGVSTSLNFRDAIRTGLIDGPDLYTAGPLIDGVGGYHPMVDVELSRPDAAAPLVRALKAQGVDLLKVYFLLEPNVLRAVIAEAKRQGLPVTGHIGVRTSWGEAIDAGIDGFNHIRTWKDFLPLEAQPQGENESLDGSKAPVARMQADWRLIDPEGAPALALIHRMAQAHIGFDPTLAIQAVSPGERRTFSLEEFAVARDAYRRMGRFVARAQREGVTLLAGTDDGDLFAELEAYVEAGVPIVEALKAATINGAQRLGKAKEFGSIEPGKRADLVLVGGDPLKEIRDLRKTELVVKNGRIVFQK